MAYNPNIPNASDYQDESQVQLKQNFQQLDTSFSINHYGFSDISGETGKHKVITTVSQGTSPTAHPTTAANEPKIYAFKSLGNIPVLNFSRGGSDAVPTAITKVHSSSAPITLPMGTTNIFDFTGINYCLCRFVFNYQNQSSTDIINSSTREYYVVYNTTLATSGGKVMPVTIDGIGNMQAGFTGTNLNVTTLTGCTQFRWVLEFLRIE